MLHYIMHGAKGNINVAVNIDLLNSNIINLFTLFVQKLHRAKCY